MSTKPITIFLTAALLLLAAVPVLAAEPAQPAVVSIQAEKGSGQNEFLFTAAVTGVNPGEGRFQVLMQLARLNGEFYDGDPGLFTPLAWNGATAAWTGTRTIDRFATDRTRRYRAVIRDAVSGATVAAGQDQTLLQPGKAPPIGRQEALDFLDKLAENYTAKNYTGFMKLVSTDFAGDDFVLSNALRKDFQLLGDISIRFTMSSITANDYFANVTAVYRRSVTPVLTGQRLNDSGITELALIKEKGQLKLYSMKKPLLFGLANGGAAATGILMSGQNQSVIQITRAGTVVVGPITSASVPVRTVVLQGYNTLGAGDNVESLRVSTGTVGNNAVMSLPSLTFFGDLAPAIIGWVAPSYEVYISAQWQLLPGVTDINRVTSVPAGGYAAAISSSSTGTGTRVFALHLSNGKYAVVQVSNWVGNADNWRATVLYKYQSDGTRNF